MTRRVHRTGPKKKKGLLVGMRQGVRSMARGKEAPSRRARILSTVVTVILVAATAGIVLNRCGVIQW
jgi:hypothetical protein